MNGSVDCHSAPGTQGEFMRMRVQLIIEGVSDEAMTAEIAAIERRDADGLIGLSLEEAKAMTAGAQRVMVEAQARAAVERESECPDCGKRLRRNGQHRIRYRTAFGRLDLDSPRFYQCRCQTSTRASISPLAAWLGTHVSPELQYLEAQFASLLSYGASARILSAVLPLQNATSITTWRRHVGNVGRHLDQEAHDRVRLTPALNEFGLPTRNPLQAVGIDGGYVKASDAASRQEGWFEVMVGKSLPRTGTGNVFAFVHRLEARPNERMERFLAEQGVDPAQATTFLSDGGDTVRQAQGEFRQFGEPILDWFHLTMRMTQLSQTIKGLPVEEPEDIGQFLRSIRRAKAFLWHGSAHRALKVIENLTWEIGVETDAAKNVQDRLEEFMDYVTANLGKV